MPRPATNHLIDADLPVVISFGDAFVAHRRALIARGLRPFLAAALETAEHPHLICIIALSATLAI